MFKMTYVLYAALTAFQGYCLQYFLGNFLETRMRGRWNGMYVAGLYVALRTAVMWCSPPGYEDYRVAAGTLALSLCILSALSLCFYKALRLITVFLVVSFQVLLDISKYTVAILLNAVDRWVLDIINWCAGKGMLASEKSFGMAVKAGVAGTQLIQYAGIALLLYVSLRKIVGDFREKDYVISRTELLFILVPSAVGMMICMLLRIIMITLEDGIPKMLYDRYPILVIVIPAILLLSLLSILYGVKLFQDMIYWNREKSGRIVLEKQISMDLCQYFGHKKLKVHADFFNSSSSFCWGVI